MKGFLLEQDYKNLKQCGSFDEFKLILDETDYGKYIQMPDGKIEVNQLKRRMQTKLRDEIEYIMGNATSPLNAFLQQMMHQYQIENIISYISGMNNQDISVLVEQMNPLGEFQGLKSVGSFASESFIDIFQDILIDLPVGCYFRSFIDNLIAQI